jgi:hypothetical protein
VIEGDGLQEIEYLGVITPRVAASPVMSGKLMVLEYDSLGYDSVDGARR